MIFSSNPEWFVVFTSPRHEKRVEQHFAARNIEAFLPTYKVKHRWKNRITREVVLPLFPNYIFVKIDRSQRVQVLEVSGVILIVGAGAGPVAVPDHHIDALKAGVAAGTIEPHPYLTVGKRVRIKAGPMAGVEGVLSEIRGHYKFVLSIELIHQSVAVEVEAGDLEEIKK